MFRCTPCKWINASKDLTMMGSLVSPNIFTVGYLEKKSIHARKFISCSFSFVIGPSKPNCISSKVGNKFEVVSTLMYVLPVWDSYLYPYRVYFCARLGVPDWDWFVSRLKNVFLWRLNLKLIGMWPVLSLLKETVVIECCCSSCWVLDDGFVLCLQRERM